MWRKFLGWAALLTLTASELLFARFLMLVQRAEEAHLSFFERLDLFLPVVRYGFWFATAALLLCWSPTLRTSACLALASIVILILWFAQAMGV